MAQAQAFVDSISAAVCSLVAFPPLSSSSPLGPTGRFAPSPTGPLHAGSLVAALASWLDARAHGGRWLVRIEDIDTPRSVVGADRIMLAQLINCGLLPDEPPLWQSRRGDLYARALQSLRDQLRVYACGCSRRDIELAWEATGQVRIRHGELVYPGTCRHGLKGKHARAWRLRCTHDDDSDLLIDWFDRRLGAQTQNVTQTIGDIVLQRTDGLWAYQMAVVVDDADQGVTHVVRGGDMTESTPRQIHLQRVLGLPTPHYLHTPVVMAADGHKLSKQNGAEAIDVSQPLAALNAAACVLGLPVQAGAVPQALAQWTLNWATHYGH